MDLAIPHREPVWPPSKEFFFPCKERIMQGIILQTQIPVCVGSMQVACTCLVIMETRKSCPWTFALSILMPQEYSFDFIDLIVMLDFFFPSPSVATAEGTVRGRQAHRRSTRQGKKEGELNDSLCPLYRFPYLLVNAGFDSWCRKVSGPGGKSRCEYLA